MTRNKTWKRVFALFLLLSVVVNGSHLAKKKRVCVIGAGVAGLSALRQLSLYPEEFEPIAFEKQSNVGGLWIYTNSSSVDKHGLPVHSSVYQNLRTNSPVEVQSLPDYREFEWDDRNSSFVRHPQLQKYLHSYAVRYDLLKYIKFDTNVVNVMTLPDLRWLLTVRDLDTKQTSDMHCDAVMVANGMNVKGNVPELPGIESFPGQVLHSHIYRRPEVYANLTVVVLGASFSGIDISIDISPYAKKIYLSHRKDKLKIELPANVEQVRGVVGAEGKELILSDGKRLKADALILCSGYIYDFPFMDVSTDIVVDGGKYVRTLYKHLINIEHPTMAILNVPMPSIALQVPTAQALYFTAVLRGKVKLPSKQEMLKNATLLPGTPRSQAHYMAEKTVSYYDELAVAGGGDPMEDWFVRATSVFGPHVLSDPLHFRSKRLHFNPDGSIEFY